MRDLLQSACRRLRSGWFLAFVLLALPNCAFSTGGLPGNTFCQGPQCPPPCDLPQSQCPGLAFEPGSEPSNAIMCDIPQPFVDTDGCASQMEVDDPQNVSLTEAATALIDNRKSSIALDWSPAATSQCPGGRPKKVVLMGGGSFPDGTTVCINCGSQIGPTRKYSTPTKACVAKCKDLINGSPAALPPGGTDAYCEANAHLSTNFEQYVCFDGACTKGGNPNPAFIDPRRYQEKLKWIDFDTTGLTFDGTANALQRTAMTSTPPAFDLGAASAQVIKSGDAWVEFSVGESGVSHVLSLRHSVCDDASVCPDTDPGLNAIGFALSLNYDGNVYVIESAPGTPQNVLGPFGLPYGVGERFRVRATDNHDGTATISYSRFGMCTPGPGCAEDIFVASTTKPAYPLRVDSSFREQNATLVNTTMVYIQQ